MATKQGSARIEEPKSLGESAIENCGTNFVIKQRRQPANRARKLNTGRLPGSMLDSFQEG